MIRTYSRKDSAKVAARKELGVGAKHGIEFEVYEHEPGRWAWRERSAEDAAAARAAAAAKSAKGRRGAKGGKAAKPRRTAKPKPLTRRAAAEAAARAGKLPAPPDFSAETHRRYRSKLAELVGLVKAGDLKGLRDYPINPISTSPRALDRYRNLAVMALESRAAKG